MTTAINLDLSFFAFPAPLVWWSFSLFTIGSLVSGFCIGVIGVGGVLLVPMLLLLQVPAQVAVGSCMFAYIAVAIVGVIIFSKKNVMPWRESIFLFVGATPSACVGSFVLQYFPGDVVIIICSITSLISGVVSTRKSVKLMVDNHKAEMREAEDASELGEVANADAHHATVDARHADPDAHHATVDARHATVDAHHADAHHADSDLHHADSDPHHADSDAHHADPDAHHATVDAHHAKVDAHHAADPDAHHADPDPHHADPDAQHTAPSDPAGAAQKTDTHQDAEGGAPTHQNAEGGATTDQDAEGGATTCCAELEAYRCQCGDLVYVLIGLVSGFGSAVTGTSGPFVTMPLLVLFRPALPTIEALALSVYIQLPVALCASLGNLLFGSIDVGLGVVIAVTLSLGFPVGALLAHKLSQAHLMFVVALMLLAVGLALLIKASVSIAEQLFASVDDPVVKNITNTNYSYNKFSL